MAVIREITDQKAADEWIKSRPHVVQDMIAQCPPNRLYRISAGQRVTIYSYSEDRTVTVDVSGEYNRVVFGRRVFGIPIDDLVECDLPGPDEDVGDTAQEAGYDQNDIEEILIPQIRDQMRRDGKLPSRPQE